MRRGGDARAYIACASARYTRGVSADGSRGYRFVQHLASGGMGSIELVVRREGAFARPYARKRLLAQFAEDRAARAMFVEEARVAGLVRHANVVGVLDVGQDDAGPFFVMDLVDGVSLLEVVRRLGRRMPVQVAAEIARQIAEGLHAAHELVAPDGRSMGLVHRDVSLSNVIVGYDGTVRVTDFGVARALDRGSFTQFGTLKGRLSYMSAEQLRHETLDRRADLYALGVVLAEMLRGGRLHDDATPEEVARRTLEEPPPDVGDERDDVPPELQALMFELLARDRDARPSDARAVATRLLAIVSALRADEGPIDLGELVRARFAEEREARAALLRAALEDREGTELAAPEASEARNHGVHDEPTRLNAPAPDRSAGPPRARAPRYVVATIGALAVCAVLAWMFGGAAGPGTEPVASAPPVQTEPAPEAAPRVAPEPAAVGADPSSADPAVAAAAGDAPLTPSRPRARRPARSSAEPEPSSSGIRTWSWE